MQFSLQVSRSNGWLLIDNTSTPDPDLVLSLSWQLNQATGHNTLTPEPDGTWRLKTGPDGLYSFRLYAAAPGQAPGAARVIESVLVTAGLEAAISARYLALASGQSCPPTGCCDELTQTLEAALEEARYQYAAGHLEALERLFTLIKNKY
jgi:hypothetical protein